MTEDHRSILANGDAIADSEWGAEKVDRIAAHVRGILDELGLDREEANLQETDRRVAKMYLEMFKGLTEGARPKVTVFPNDEGYSSMVMEKGIPFYSMCSHHLVPFYGHAHWPTSRTTTSSASRNSAGYSSSTPSGPNSRSG